MGRLFSKSCTTFPEVVHDRFSDNFCVHTMRHIAHNRSCTTKSSRVDGPYDRPKVSTPVGRRPSICNYCNLSRPKSLRPQYQLTLFSSLTFKSFKTRLVLGLAIIDNYYFLVFSKQFQII